ERLRTTSMSAVSPQLSTRPSANASSAPVRVLTIAGMRKQLYPCSWAALNRTCWVSAGPAAAWVMAGLAAGWVMGELAVAGGGPARRRAAVRTARMTVPLFDRTLDVGCPTLGP